MSVPITQKDPTIKSTEIDSWLKKQRLKKTQINITRATNALRAEKLENSLPAGKDVSYTGSDAPRRIVYGETMMGGSIVFLDSRGNNQYIDTVIALTTHEIEGVVGLRLDDCDVIFQSGSDGWSASLRKPDGTIIPALNKIFLRVATGADDQFAIGDLIGQNPAKWTWDHKLSGVAHAYIIFVWDAFLFGDGLPDITFRIQGKQVYDPRYPTVRYTATAALCIADYLTNSRFGVGVDYDERIDEGNLVDAANVCDELVDLQAGGQEYRYTINGWFDTDQSHGAVLEKMAAAMGGHITYSNGKWKFWPAAWRAPTLTLTEDDLRSSIKLQVMTTRDDIFNSVRGTFVSAAKDFIEVDYPPVKNSSYIALDGSEIVENIDFHLVTSTPTVQRLAKLELERIRQGIQFDCEVSPRLFAVQVPENIMVTLPRYGWDEKEFEVVRADFILRDFGDGQEIVVSLSLRETGEAVFEWNYWEETIGDVIPNTNLPSPFSVPAVTGLMLESGTAALYKRGDGTIAPRIMVTWTAFSDFFLTSGGYVELQYKPSASGTWIDAPRVPASSATAYLTDVQDGVLYDVRARSVNTFSNASDYTTILSHFVIGKTAPPATVSGLSAIVSDYGISLGWPKVTDFDLRDYEIREGSSWDTAILLAHTQSTSYNLNVRAAGSYTFLIKAVDTSGNYSTTATSATVTIVGPSILAAAFSIEGSNVILDWDEATAGSWAIDIYDVYYGDVFATATFLNSTKASTTKVLAAWSGVRTFWIVARDIYGNASTPISIAVQINNPNPVISFSASVIDNNVLCRWTEPAVSTLPIAKYIVKKGDDYGSAETIGEILSTFTVLFELISGRFTYWVVAVDTAGNSSTEVGTTVAVSEPPDFQLIAQVTLTNGTTLTNCREGPPGTILLAVNTTRSFEDHFLVQGWMSPQDQIDDGFPVFIQPTRDYGRWEKIHDLGTTVTNVLIHLDYTKTNIVGTPTLLTKIAYSTDGVSYTEESGVVAVLAAAVRYIRVRLDYGVVP